MIINGGLHHCFGKEVSRFEQGKDDFIDTIDDVCIHYDGDALQQTKVCWQRSARVDRGKQPKKLGLIAKRFGQSSTERRLKPQRSQRW
jgi:hypothetical protein